MKKIIGATIGILLFYTSSSQREVHVSLNATISSFRGNIDPYAYSAYGNNTQNVSSNKGYYGTQKGLGWSVEFSAQRVFPRSGIVLGIASGYERLNSRLLLSRQVAATGQYTDQTAHSIFGFWNIYPYLGKRFYLGKHAIDADLGPELGLPLSAVLKVKGEDTYKTKQGGDFRLRLQAKWQYKNYGAQASYAIGILDYHDFINFSGFTAYSNIGKLGVFYRLIKRNKTAR